MVSCKHPAFGMAAESISYREMNISLLSVRLVEKTFCIQAQNLRPSALCMEETLKWKAMQIT